MQDPRTKEHYFRIAREAIAEANSSFYAGRYRYGVIHMSEASELIAKGLIMDNPTLLYLSLGEAKQKDIDGILKVYGHEWYLELLDLLGALFKKDKGDFIKSVISLANTPLIPDNINSSYNINGDELQKLKVIAENEKVVKNPPIDLIDISIKLLNNYFHLQDSEICCVQLLDYFVIKI